MSSDPIDQACDLEQRDRDLNIRIAREAAADPVLKPTGSCHYCDAPVAPEACFCDRDCGEDYEALEAAKKRNGRGQ